MIEIRTPQTDDPCSEMSEFQFVSCDALSAFLTMTTRGDATDTEVAALNRESWALIDYMRALGFKHPQDRVYVLLFAAFAQIGPLEEMKEGGRFGGDPADAIRRFADWVDANRTVNA